MSLKCQQVARGANGSVRFSIVKGQQFTIHSASVMSVHSVAGCYALVAVIIRLSVLCVFGVPKYRPCVKLEEH